MSLIKYILNEVQEINNNDPYIYDDPKLVEMLEKTIEPSSFICSYVASAVKMLEGDSIKIYGFSVSENPEAMYFVEEHGEECDEGHHFTVMDDRYIIDPWVYDNFDRSVFDLQNKKDEDIITYIYGDKNNWTDITNRTDDFKQLFPKTYKTLMRYHNSIL